MLFRPFLHLYRKQLIWSACLSLAAVLLFHMIVSSESPTDIGVFWHHFCGCPADPDDTRILFMSVNFLMFLLGAAFGINANPNNRILVANRARFLLTRPVSRLALQIYPLVISATAIIVFPAAAWLLLLGWLRLVGAPSLGHLTALAELIPAASRLGDHPSLFSVLSALHFGRLYLGQVSAGLALYTLFASQSWLILSPRKWLVIPGALIGALFFLSYLALRIRWVSISCFLMWPKQTLYALPSTLNITLHFAFIALMLVLAGFCIREAEL